MSAKSGWYPDPGGGLGLYRYWDGKAWSAATSANPGAAPPSAGLGAGPIPSAFGGQSATSLGGASGGQPTSGSQPSAASGQPFAGQGGQPYGGGNQPLAGQGGRPYSPYGSGGSAGSGGSEYLGGQSAYASYQATKKKRSPVGWWIAGAALVVVIVVVAVIAVRAVTGGGLGTPTGQGSENACPQQSDVTAAPPASNDGRVHGGPVSYPELPNPPWSEVKAEDRVPFGSDVSSQEVTVQAAYDGTTGHDWVASVLVGELQAGDGFFSPEQGAGIVVKCILGAFYGDNPVNRNDVVNQKDTIDGHDAWLVESHLTFNIPGLVTKGELLIVAIVSAGATSGLYYASIPDTAPELVKPAREALAKLKVDG